MSELQGFRASKRQDKCEAKGGKYDIFKEILVDFNVILKVGEYFPLSFGNNVNKSDVNKQLLPFFCKNNITPIS